MSSLNLDSLAKMVKANHTELRNSLEQVSKIQKSTDERLTKLEAKFASAGTRSEELELLNKPVLLTKAKFKKDFPEIQAKVKDIIQTKVLDKSASLFAKGSKDLYSNGLEDRVDLFTKAIFNGDKALFTKSLDHEKSLMDKFKATTLASEINAAGAKHNLHFDFVELYTAYNDLS